MPDPKEDIFDEIPVRDAQGNTQVVAVGVVAEPAAPHPTPLPQGERELPAPSDALVHAVEDEEEGRMEAIVPSGVALREEEIVKAADALIPTPPAVPPLDKGGSVRGSASDESLHGRLRTVILAALKDVRDLGETADILVRPRAKGGIEMPGIAARALTDRIAMEKARLEEKYGAGEKRDKSETEARPRQNFVKQNLGGQIPNLKAQTPIKSSRHFSRDPDFMSGQITNLKTPSQKSNFEPAVAPPRLVKSQPIKPKPTTYNLQPTTSPTSSDLAPASAPKAISMVPGKPMPRPPEPKPAGKIAIPKAENGKPKVQDVAYTAKLVGPIEEIKTLRLVDFRRLSKDPTLAIEKILGKIDLIAEQGTMERAKAIGALYQSPLYAQYAELLQTAVARGLGPAALIAERQSKKEETLTMEEFSSLVAAGRRLRM